MIALDTSALVRYLTDDDPALAAEVEMLVEGERPVGLSSLVLLEAVHVLRGSHYRRRNPELADTLVALLAHENVELTDLDAELASAAMLAVRERSPRHLADALIAAAARQAGAERLVTNDRRFVSGLVEVDQLGGNRRS